MEISPPGATNEGLALFVLVRTGAFADEHDVGILVAHPEDEFGAAFVEAAAGAFADVVEDLGEGSGFVEYRKFIVGLRRGMPRVYWLKSFEVADIFWLAAVEITQAHLAGILHTGGEGCSLVGCEWHSGDFSSENENRRGAEDAKEIISSRRQRIFAAKAILRLRSPSARFAQNDKKLPLGSGQ